MIRASYYLYTELREISNYPKLSVSKIQQLSEVFKVRGLGVCGFRGLGFKGLGCLRSRGLGFFV